jgi:hypothetical protein
MIVNTLHVVEHVNVDCQSLHAGCASLPQRSSKSSISTMHGLYMACKLVQTQVIWAVAAYALLTHREINVDRKPIGFFIIIILSFKLIEFQIFYLFV